MRGGVDKRGLSEVSPLVLRYKDVTVCHFQTSAEQGLEGDSEEGFAAGGGGGGRGGGMKVGRLRKSQTLDTGQSDESCVTYYSTKFNSTADLHDVLIGHVPTLEQVCRRSRVVVEVVVVVNTFYLTVPSELHDVIIGHMETLDVMQTLCVW